MTKSSPSERKDFCSVGLPNEVYPTNALCGLNLISTFIPVEFEEVLFSLDPTEQKSFLSLGEDFVIVNDKTINLKGNLLLKVLGASKPKGLNGIVKKGYQLITIC
jgi:hypothetical protein